ncbi:MAG: amidohydrolase family protein [Pirellulales bacterium]|nr:amidohydrolase family protein [Pirellulales bacterium]
MIIDGHIHIRHGEKDPDLLMRRLAEAGMDGGVVISLPPQAYSKGKESAPATERLDDLMTFTANHERLYPLFWIDPTENDATEQVDEAVAQGVAGFKVICHNFDAGDPRAMKTFRAIAEQEKSILFHSGILWDGMPSSPFNRPSQFEALLEIDGLRFSLAHISWPWCDELIAVYGKFLNAYDRRPDLSVEMFVDITPGTPPIYRRDALTKLFTVGYDVQNNVIFGTDCDANDYNVAWGREWIARDDEIYEQIGLGPEVRKKIYHDNLMRFLGISKETVTRKILRPGQ